MIKKDALRGGDSVLTCSLFLHLLIHPPGLFKKTSDGSALFNSSPYKSSSIYHYFSQLYWEIIHMSYTHPFKSCKSMISVHLQSCAPSAAAAAKSLPSCPTRRPPGSPFPGILQARTLEGAAISFSSAWKWKGKVTSPRPNFRISLSSLKEAPTL